jgi:hypothetical protein
MAIIPTYVISLPGEKLIYICDLKNALSEIGQSASWRDWRHLVQEVGRLDKLRPGVDFMQQFRPLFADKI